MNQQSNPGHFSAHCHNLDTTAPSTRGICTYWSQENQVPPPWQIQLSEWVLIKASPTPGIERQLLLGALKEDKARERKFPKPKNLQICKTASIYVR